MPGPLAGIKIVDLTTILMGPYATQILGDMGADVIKIESINGDPLRFANQGRNPGMSNLFLNNNRNKRSLTLNLKHAAGRTALFKLLQRCDAFVSNIRPPALARLGLSYSQVVAVNPQIVYVICFGFGQSGPYADRAAYDDLIQTMIGVPNLFERAYGDEPKFLPANFCDRVTGLNVVNAVTSALFYRERTGRGQSVEIPMFETMVQFLMSDHLGGYTFEPPMGSPGYTRIINPNRRPYATKDGYMAVLVYNDKQWAEFFCTIGRPDLIGEGIFNSMNSRGANILEVYGFVQEMLSQRTTQEWLDLFCDTDIPHAVVHSLEELFDDEHLKNIDFFREFEHPSEGRLRTTDIPSRWSESQPILQQTTPRLGEHSKEILQELGYKESEIRALVDAGTTSIVAESFRQNK
ncbi:CoA transferase [Chloroflexi bacterium TSY]|nr:CoA transferase [Chloroflexi bacterium TSY]